MQRKGEWSFVRRICVLLPIAALLFAGCSPRSFPVVRPAPRYDKEHIARLRAEEYFIRGRDYDRRGLPQMAARLYEMAYEFDPSSDEVRLLLAGKYIELGKYPQAVITISRDREVGELSEIEKNLLVTAYLKMGQFSRAAETIEQLKTRTSENLYSLALIHESLGETDKAIDAYLAFLRHKPDAVTVGLKTAALMVRAKRLESADSLVRAFEQQHGKTPEILVMRGATAFARGDTAGALESYRDALAIDSTHEDALQSLAQIQMARREYKEAIAAYERLYRTQTWGAVYGRTLSLLYYYDEQYDKASALLHELIAGDMQDHELHFYLGLVAAERDSQDVARLEFEKSVALHSSFEDAWQHLCLVALRQKDNERALVDAERFVAALDTKPSAWRMLGHVHAVRKEYGQAVDAFRKVVVLDSSSGQAWFDLGSAHERLKDLDSAAAAFRRALSINPGDHVAANYLGYMWAERGMNLDSAEELIGMALRHEPDNGAYLDSYAWVFYQRGSYDSARVYMERALEKVGEDPVVLEHLGDVRVKLGRYAEAAQAYRTALELDPDDPQRVRAKLEAARTEAGEESP